MNPHGQRGRQDPRHDEGEWEPSDRDGGAYGAQAGGYRSQGGRDDRGDAYQGSSFQADRDGDRDDGRSGQGGGNFGGNRGDHRADYRGDSRAEYRGDRGDPGQGVWQGAHADARDEYRHDYRRHGDVQSQGGYRGGQASEGWGGDRDRDRASAGHRDDRGPAGRYGAVDGGYGGQRTQGGAYTDSGYGGSYASGGHRESSARREGWPEHTGRRDFGGGHGEQLGGSQGWHGGTYDGSGYQGGSYQNAGYEGGGYQGGGYQGASQGGSQGSYQGAYRSESREGGRPGGQDRRGGFSDGSRHGGPGLSQQQGRHFDPDYEQWRHEQMRNLDADYHGWRQDRYQKFSDDFNKWRSERANRRSDIGQNDPADSTRPGQSVSSPGSDFGSAGAGRDAAAWRASEGDTSSVNSVTPGAADTSGASASLTGASSSSGLGASGSTGLPSPGSSSSPKSK